MDSVTILFSDFLIFGFGCAILGWVGCYIITKDEEIKQVRVKKERAAKRAAAHEAWRKAGLV
jgi:hypothetical protein